MNYELIIMVASPNIDILEISLSYIRKNISPVKIIGIGALKYKAQIEDYGIDFLDEDKVIEGLTYDNIEKLISKRGEDINRTGWYFQQFLKYAYSYISNTEFYLVWDSDTIPLNKVEFFCDGNPCCIIKKEYHKAYFNTLNRLFNGSVFRVDKNISYIAENMMFNKKIVQEIIVYIENNHTLYGKRYFEKILFSIDKEEFECGFSEFETYGNYVELNYPRLYKKICLRTLRDAVILIGNKPCYEQLNWIKKDYDIISLEKNKVSFSWLTKGKMFRKIVPAKILAGILFSIRKVKRNIQRKEIISYD